MKVWEPMIHIRISAQIKTGRKYWEGLQATFPGWPGAGQVVLFPLNTAQETFKIDKQIFARAWSLSLSRCPFYNHDIYTS